MASIPSSSASNAATNTLQRRLLTSTNVDTFINTFPINGVGGTKRQLPEPEVIALNELLDTFPSEIEDTQGENSDNYKRMKMHLIGGRSAATSCHYRLKKPFEKETKETEEEKKERQRGEEEEEDFGITTAARKEEDGAGFKGVAGGHTKLTDLIQYVRNIERENLHLKQALLLRKNDAGRSLDAVHMDSWSNFDAVSSLTGLRSIRAQETLGILGLDQRANVERLLFERTKVVTDMVEHLNSSFLLLGDASRIWHEDCRISAGVCEWDAFGRLQAISLWNMIRSVFKSIVVDVVELRPHLPNGEMMLTKWRIQGAVASAQQLQRVCASEECSAIMRVVLMALKSSDLTFTVTTYIVFQDLCIVEQHHCWDQVGVFKRLFGGEIPPTVQKMLVIDGDTIVGRKQLLDV